ncbi:ABC transporter substrate-binding protein [Thermodesulfobacteriota bacterium]
MKNIKQFIFFTVTLVMVLKGVVMGAPQKPSTVAELALYKASNRQQILVEGARKEGTLNFYTSGILTQAVRPVVNAFTKKYPFIKVHIWRAGSKGLMGRVMEEHKSGKYYWDVLESTQVSQMMVREARLTQPFYSPNFAYIEEEAITRAPDGEALTAPIRSSGISLGYNTKLVAKKEVPKTYQELLDPKWKGKIPIIDAIAAVNWMGTILQTNGEQFLKQLARQEFIVNVVGGRALCDLIISGEYALSPIIFDSHVFKSKKLGAPVDWVPLEPVMCNLGQLALSKYSAHPHAALLFIDHELTKEGAEIHKKAGYNAFHKDVLPLMKPYKKAYGPKSLDEVQKWNTLFDKLFLLR